MNVPDVGRNLVPDTWTTDGESTPPKVGTGSGNLKVPLEKPKIVSTGLKNLL